MLHLLGQKRCHLLALFDRALDNQLVVYLQDEPRLKLLLAKRLVHMNHRELDDIRRRALNGRIERDALAERTDVEIAALELGEIASSSKHRRHKAVPLRLRNDIFHVLPHARVILKIVFDIRLCFLPRHADILGKGKLRNTVDDAKIDSLRVPAHEGRHVLRRNMEDLRGRRRVDVHAGSKRSLHVRVVCDMRQNAQLNLAVVRVDKHPAVLRHEHFSDFASKLRAHGNVLEIRLCGAEPPGRRDHVLERRVDPAVVRDLLDKAISIGRFQLCKRPVV